MQKIFNILYVDMRESQRDREEVLTDSRSYMLGFEIQYKISKSKLEMEGKWTEGNCMGSWACEVEKIKKDIVLWDLFIESSVFWKTDSMQYNFILLLCHS